MTEMSVKFYLGDDEATVLTDGDSVHRDGHCDDFFFRKVSL